MSRLALALLFLGGCSSPSTSTGAALRAGAARVEITPHEPIRLSGYSARTAPSDGVEHPLYARAVAIDQGGCAIIVSADAIAVSAALTEEIARRVQASTGVPRERFALCASHSHTAPALTGVIPNILDLKEEEKPVIERYTRFFVDQVVKVAEEAFNNRADASLSVGWTTTGFAGNRRTPGGPVDQDVPVLRVSSPEGKLRALLFGYACHCTTLGFNKVTGDWAGFAQSHLEAVMPGVVAACLIGCGADQNPNPRSTLDLAKRHGQSLARAVEGLVSRGDLRPVAGTVTGRFANVDLPFDRLPTKEELQTKLEKGPPQEKRLAKMLLERMPSSIPYPVQTIRIGEDLAFVILGGEVVVDHSLRLKREYDPGRIWSVGYSNDVPGYIPSERILAEGGYEGGGAMVWYGQPARFAKGVEEIIHRKIAEVLPESFRRPPPAPVKSPVDPKESLKHFVIEPGFEIDLVACEPHVYDPVHLSWDARGRMYVTEMIDYPEGPPSGRIMRLEDTDGDGRVDKATVFADTLAFPTSAMPWRDGILVTADPDLFYLEDTDGDGKADTQKVLFTGFAGGNTQHRVNSLQWGIDNWIYGGNGDSAATIKSVTHPDRAPVTMTFADFRFRPDTGEFETLAEHSGYAMTFDDAGNRFVTGSGGNMRHVVMDRPLRDRNPFVPGITNAQRLESRSKLFPVSGQIERFNDPLDVGFFTAASGLHVYRGGIFPQHYQGNLFIGDSAGNLVHRDVLVRQGASFIAAPHTQPAEFLASRDPWFRPVFLTTGPDGCLYIADMYRAVIEHPEWIPNDIEKTLDLKAGNDKGRIYRIRHRSQKPVAQAFQPEVEPSSALVDRLESPNGWVRDTAQRLLYERQDRSVVDRLLGLILESTSGTTRLQAMWTLDGLGASSRNSAVSRGADRDAPVREAAARFAGLGALPLAKDPDLRVRLRAAAILGQFDSKEAVEALGDLMFDPSNDEWVRNAAALSKPEISHRILNRVAERIGKSAAESTRILPSVWKLATAVGARNDAHQIREALELLLPEAGAAMSEWQMVGFGGGIVDGLGKKGGTPGKRVKELASPERLARAIEEAARMAEDPRIIDGTRFDALIVLGVDESRRHLEVLKKHLSPKHAPEIQSGAIRGVSYLDEGADAARMLFQHWTSYAPAQRDAVLDATFRRPDRVPALLEAMEKKQVSVAELADGRKEQLRRLSNETDRKRAATLLEGDKREDRKKVVEARRPSLQMTGRRAPGIALFQKHCAECHPIQGVGPAVGPDLVRIRKREREGLLLDLLDPNASVAPNFVAYNLMTKDEIIHSGLVVSQSPAAVTLRLKGGAERTIPRAQIEELKSTGKSLMPEMFETVLSDQDIADLIEYMRQIQ